MELGSKNWDTAQIEGGEHIASLVLSTRHIGERWIPTLGGALEHDIFFGDVGWGAGQVQLVG